MRDEPNWPRFELVTFAEATGIPHGWDRDLIALGVPKHILGDYYKAVSHLELIEHPTLGPLVCFATVGTRGAMGLHPATGSIHWLTGARSGREWFVNTTLAQFNEAVRAVINRFPFDRGVPSEAPLDDAPAQWPASNTVEGDEVQWGVVGEELRELLRRIDPESVATPGYWNRFVTDVGMGDYSTEDVLTPPERGRVIRQLGTTDRCISER